MTGQQLDWSVQGKCPATGKVRLATMGHAETLIASYRKRYGWLLRSYVCPTCHSYHLSRVHRPGEG